MVSATISFAVATPLSGYNPATLPLAPDGPFVATTVFAADTALPVVRILDDTWRGQFTPKRHNTGDLYWNAGAGVVASGWRVALFNRAEFFIESNRDAIEFFYSEKTKRDLDTSRIYRAEMKAKGFIASGVEVSHGRRLDALLPGLSVGATLRYLDPTYLQDGTLTGTVRPLGPKSYDFDLLLDYRYSRNILYHRSGEDIGSGYGFSSDLGLSYRKGRIRGEVLVRDLFGAIFWNAAPYTTARAVTPTVTTSENGYQEFTPSISGFEGNKSFRQRIPLKTDLSMGYEGDRWSASASATFIEDDPRTWLEVGYRLKDDVGLSLAYNFDYGAVSYGVAARGFTMALTMEGLKLEEANALGLQLGYHYSW